mgnify:CR=1 FL=1
MATSTKVQFLENMLPYAQQVQADTGVNAVNVLAQWAHETGYGTNSGAANNNYAGLYAYNGSPYGTSGKRYTSISNFLTDYEKTISNKRYNGALTAATPTAFAQALKAGGYASDPNYSQASTWTEVPKLMAQYKLSTGSGSTYPFARYNPLVGGSSSADQSQSSTADKITSTTKEIVSNFQVDIIRVILALIAVGLLFIVFRNGVLGGNA